jgi:hypothetical protein
MGQLVLKRAAASRLSGEWSEDDYDVLAGDVVIGRIFNAAASPVGTPWMWTLLYGYYEDRSPTHGYEPTREAAGGGPGNVDKGRVIRPCATSATARTMSSRAVFGR